MSSFTSSIGCARPEMSGSSPDARAGSKARLTVAALRCEHRVDPLGIDVSAPRLSWELASDRRDERQTAYQVLVASRPERLREDAADLWDSERVVSDRSHLVPYEGQALASSQRVYWTARCWDRDGRASEWSRPASWTMGILDEHDWRADWIRFGWPEDFELSLEGASWIWSDEDVMAYPDLSKRAPIGERLFERKFDVPATDIVSARLAIVADNSYQVYINGGTPVGHGSDWRQGQCFDVWSDIHPGSVNWILVLARNGPVDARQEPNPAGLIARLSIVLGNGTRSDVVTDADWDVADVRIGAQEPVSAEEQFRRWVDPRVWGSRSSRNVAPWGSGPWGRVRCSSENPPSLPIARKEFRIDEPVRRALLHVSGLGHCAVFLDGERIGERFLDPGWTLYEKTIPYSTFDVSDKLALGVHAIGVLLGKGFYDSLGNRRVHGFDADRPLALRLDLEIGHEDGCRGIVATDTSWTYTNGPITHDAIHGGEDWDARLLPDGWDCKHFDDSSWKASSTWNGPGGRLCAQVAPPLTEHDVFAPVSIDEPEPGHWVYDFGQNCMAIPRLRVRGKSGQSVRLVPAEQRLGATYGKNDGHGRVNQAGIGTPQFMEYTLRGDAHGESWSPLFFYSGFQYLEVEGAVPAGRPNPLGLPEIVALESVHVRNDADTIGEFECSNELFNRIHRLVDWSVKSNLSHVLTDCPHREKLGWLEVSWLMGPSIAWRYDISGFYAKIARDCRDSQHADGIIDTVAPAYPGTLFGGGYQFTTEWGAAGVFVPWQLYRYCGDERVLAESYDSMERYVDALTKLAGDDFLLPDTGLGDWYDYGHGQDPGPSRFTPTDLTATATWAMCVEVLEKSARALHRPEAEVRYHFELWQKIRTAFRARWFDARTSTFTNHGSPQCANAMALVAGLVDESETPLVADAIVADVRARGNQQTAGDVGHRFLLRALADAGRSDVVFDIENRTEKGSYGGILAGGWTSLPESWDADPRWSMQHCMLGHVMEWLQEDVGGIRLDPDVPGYKTFLVKPNAVGDLTWCRTSHRSPYGTIRCEWRKSSDRFELDLDVPANTSATVYLPARASNAVFEGVEPISRSKDVTEFRIEGRDCRFRVGSGHYRFRVELR